MAGSFYSPFSETFEVEMVIIPHFLFGQKLWKSLDETLIVRCFLEKGYSQGVLVILKEDEIQTEIELVPLNKFASNNRFFIIYPEMDKDLNIQWKFLLGEMNVLQAELEANFSNILENI